jgi:hypothetical protein
MTTGENGPNLAVLPIVHRGATVTAAGATTVAGRRQTKADAAIEAVAERSARRGGKGRARGYAGSGVHFGDLVRAGEVLGVSTGVEGVERTAEARKGLWRQGSGVPTNRIEIGWHLCHDDVDPMPGARKQTGVCGAYTR